MNRTPASEVGGKSVTIVVPCTESEEVSRGKSSTLSKPSHSSLVSNGSRKSISLSRINYC